MRPQKRACILVYMSGSPVPLPPPLANVFSTPAIPITHARPAPYVPRPCTENTSLYIGKLRRGLTQSSPRSVELDKVSLAQFRKIEYPWCAVMMPHLPCQGLA